MKVAGVYFKEDELVTSNKVVCPIPVFIKRSCWEEQAYPGRLGVDEAVSVRGTSLGGDH